MKPKEQETLETIGTNLVGKMALVDLAKYCGEWPQVAKIIKENGTKVAIHWYRGARTTTWSPCTRFVPGGGRKREPWLEQVPQSSVFFWGFELTPSGCLPKQAKDALDKYESY